MPSKIAKLLDELADKYPEEPAYIATVHIHCVHQDCCKFAKRIRAAIEAELAEKDKMREALERLQEWAALDWNENAYLDQKSGNHLKLIHGILDITSKALAGEEVAR